MSFNNIYKMLLFRLEKKDIYFRRKACPMGLKELSTCQKAVLFSFSSLGKIPLVVITINELAQRC